MINGTVGTTISPHMDKATKIILGVYCVTVTFLVLIVPWSFVKRDVRFDTEYSFLLSEVPGKSIDYGMIALEITAVTAVAAIAYVFRGSLGQLPLNSLRDNANKLGQNAQSYWVDDLVDLIGLGSKKFRCNRITMVVLAAILLYLLYGLVDAKVIQKEVYLLLSLGIAWRMLYLF